MQAQECYVASLASTGASNDDDPTATNANPAFKSEAQLAELSAAKYWT